MKALSKALIILLVLFFAVTIPKIGFASPLAVSVTCMDDELGGGLFARQYSCIASASGGTPPYTYDWQGDVSFSFGDFAVYWKFNCPGPIGNPVPNNRGTGSVVVEDNVGNLAAGSDVVILDC